MKKIFTIIFVCALTLAFKADAQEDFYKVYQYETPLVGHVEFSLYNTYVGSSDLSLDYFGKKLTRESMFAHSAEAELGITDHFAIGGYADFEDPEHGKFNFVRSHFVARYRFFQRYDKWVNTAVYLEYYFPNEANSSSQKMEARVILDKDLNDFRVALNPMITVNTTGKKDKSVQPGIDAGVYYRRHRIQPGLEFYTNLKEKTALVFPTVDLYLSPIIDWQIGAGFGLNSESDAFTLKSILKFDVTALRPSLLFNKKK